MVRPSKPSRLASDKAASRIAARVCSPLRSGFWWVSFIVQSFDAALTGRLPENRTSVLLCTETSKDRQVSL